MQNGIDIILANTCNGLWVKMPEECYIILQECIDKNITVADLMDYLADDEDREYISSLIENLIKADIILKEDKKEVREINSFMFEITNHCNLACKHCCYAVNYNNKEEILDTKQIKAILKKIITVNPKAIVLTGGEAMHRPDFFQILDFLSSNFDGNIGLMTNGTYINESNVEHLCSALTNIDISLDGVNEESCSQIRGKGVFEKVINSVKLCKEAGLQEISLSMVVTKINRHLIHEFNELNKKLGTIPMLRTFEVEGRGEINKDLFLDEEYLKEFEMPSKEFNILTAKEREEARKTKRIRTCNACSSTFSIDYRGYMYPCQLLDKDSFLLCDINKISINEFKEFINEGMYITKGYENFSNIIPQKCKNCNVNPFCITCYAHLLDIKKQSKEYQDSYCENMKFDLNQIVWDI